MRFEFTPAASRALAIARSWASCDDSDELRLPELLLGLLSEPECRAALILARHAVDPEAVRRRFPGLRQLDASACAPDGRFSPEWRRCLETLERLLVDYPHPFELATEHLLLGLVA